MLWPRSTDGELIPIQRRLEWGWSVRYNKTRSSGDQLPRRLAEGLVSKNRSEAKEPTT